MAKFDDHILQARRNLVFLECINKEVSDCHDWQVTVCFYTALHLVNGHLSRFNLQYRQHSDVKNAINPYAIASPSKLPEEEYTSYVSLFSLSRRSRYLVNDKDLSSDRAFLIYDKHLAKAIRHLDRLIIYFDQEYSLTFPKAKLYCSSINKLDELKHLQIITD